MSGKGQGAVAGAGAGVAAGDAGVTAEVAGTGALVLPAGRTGTIGRVGGVLLSGRAGGRWGLPRLCWPGLPGLCGLGLALLTGLCGVGLGLPLLVFPAGWPARLVRVLMSGRGFGRGPVGAGEGCRFTGRALPLGPAGEGDGAAASSRRAPCMGRERPSRSFIAQPSRPSTQR